MKIQVNRVQNKPGVALLAIRGDLDATNYMDLFNKVQNLRQIGTRQIIMDISQVRFISISGILGLHWSLLLMNGYQLQAVEDGWSALHAVTNESRSLNKWISLVGLQPGVENTLDNVGLKDYFVIYPNIETALGAKQAT